MLKAKILLENLKNGTAFTYHAISSRNPLPILLNLLLESRDGELIISATDLEIGIRVKEPANVGGEGAVTVSAKTFLDLIGNIDQEKIELEEEEGGLVLLANKLKTRFPIVPATEFPRLYEEKGQKKAVFEKNV